MSPTELEGIGPWCESICWSWLYSFLCWLLGEEKKNTHYWFSVVDLASFRAWNYLQLFPFMPAHLESLGAINVILELLLSVLRHMYQQIPSLKLLHMPYFQNLLDVQTLVKMIMCTFLRRSHAINMCCSCACQNLEGCLQSMNNYI